MDNPYKNDQNTGPEGKATMITATEMTKEATLVLDRKTGEWYDPSVKFDELLKSTEFMDVMKRLSVR